MQGDSGGRRRGAAEVSGPLRTAILAGSMLGALLIFVAEFTTLFRVHVETSSTSIKAVTTGSHHTYALIPIAVLVAAMAFGVWRDGSRPALLAIGLLGIVSLVIALVVDLPDANATGLAGSSTTHYVNASSTPSAGLYLETLGGFVLVLTCGLGFMALGSPAPRTPRRQAPAPPSP